MSLVPVALFDLDNTLVDRASAFHRWALGFVARHGLGPGAVEVIVEADEDGYAARDAFFGALRERLAVTDPVAELEAAYRSAYPDAFTPDPAVQKAVARLRGAGWRVGIVTNGPPTQRVKIERAGLAHLVDAVGISAELRSDKPDRRIFEEVVRRCGSDPADTAATWVLGDTAHTDIVGGRALGFRTVWFHRGRSWAVPDFRPDAVAGDVPEAVELLLGPADWS
jgi:FMN phosphatase YigB (HAD superfamily)